MYAAHTANKDGTYNVVPYLSPNVLNRCPDLLCNTIARAQPIKVMDYCG